MASRPLVRMSLSEPIQRKLASKSIKTAEDFFKRHSLELIDMVSLTPNIINIINNIIIIITILTYRTKRNMGS
jgi:hypothetical protein